MSLNKKMWMPVLGLVISVAAASCQRGGSGSEDPKRRLNDYISKSFSIKKAEEKSELASFLTGPAKNRLIAWSDEQFRQAFIDSKRQFVKLAFTELKNTSPTEVSITYELTYIDQARGADAKVTNKKLAQLIQESGRWNIREVHNIKELVEYRNEMSLP